MDPSLQQKKPAATAASARGQRPNNKIRKKPPPSVVGNNKKKEKRLKRYRSSCPTKLQDRLLRARTQRLYLVQQSEIPPAAAEIDDGNSAAAADVGNNNDSYSVDFTVLGSTGNVYTVQLGHVPTCNCPDFHKHYDLCKHILFILVKVLGLDIRNPLAFQKAYITSELQELFEILRSRRVGGTVLANARVRAAVAGGKNSGAAAEGANDDESKVESDSTNRRSLEQDADCPICFDSMQDVAETQLTYCRGTCGANFHADCIRRWLGAASSQKRGCPNCRQPWIDVDDDDKNRATNNSNKRNSNTLDEGYANFGQLQGQSSVRDTSTYHSPPSSYYGASRRRRRRYY